MCLALAGPGLAGIATMPPDVAVDDAYSTDEEVALTVDTPGVMANDAAPELACVAAVDTSALSGDVSLASDGSFLFMPAPNDTGPTSFSYGLMLARTEGCPGPYVDTATVTITVNPVNDPPEAAADAFQALVGRTLNVNAPGVLRNDTDVDGDSLTAVKVTDPSHGVVVLAADGAFSYTPTAGYVGPDAFSYRASDGAAQSAPRVVTLTVTTVPSPTASPTPAPTPVPTVAPPTSQPTSIPSAEPSPSEAASASPWPTDAPPTTGPSPSATAAPAPVDEEGRLGLPLLLVVVLSSVLLLFGAAFAIPRWLGAREGAGAPGVDDGFDGPDGGAR